MMPLFFIKFGRKDSWLKAIGSVFIGMLLESSTSALMGQTVNTQSSFTDKIELADPKSVIANTLAETEILLKQNLILQEQARSLSETLVSAKAETELTKTENRELKSRIEALGLNAIGNDRAKLEQRLIKAVSDLNVARNELSETRKNMASLTEAVLTLLKTSNDVSPESRLAVEAELRTANQASGSENEDAQRAEAVSSDLSNARVISYKPEIGLLVGNIGANNSVKIGMPFRVYDGQKAIALVRVVDVRAKLFGALIQETLSENSPVKVGCRLKVAAN